MAPVVTTSYRRLRAPAAIPETCPSGEDMPSDPPARGARGELLVSGSQRGCVRRPAVLAVVGPPHT
jgi:hypothetical protein